MALVAIKNPEDALDIVQDAMLALAKKYSNKPAQQWPPLFYRILGNRITDFHRTSTLRRRLFGWFETDKDDPNAMIDQAQAPTASNPDRGHMLEHVSLSLQQALAALPRRQQQAFMLRAWEGLDVKASAQAMGCSAGSVKTHYSRAVHSLRDTLQDHYDE